MHTNRKKVLFVITKSNWGGAQRYVFDLATSLPGADFDAAVALGGTGNAGASSGTLEKKLEAAGMRTFFIHSLTRDISYLSDFHTTIELVRLFREERPDIVHLNSSKAGGLGALAARIARVPKIIFTSHGLAHDEDRSSAARLLIYLATWATFLLCHTVITISTDNYERARKFPFCGNKMRLVHNGLPQLQFLGKDAAREELVTKLHLHAAPNAPWIGMLGELASNKGVQYLVRAGGILHRSDVEFFLCIIGEGDERKSLEELVAKENLTERVVLLGHVPEGYRYLRAFDIFALTSVKEGLPYVLIEAGQAGLPAIASRVSGTADIIGNEMSGLWVESKNPEDIAKKLRELLLNPELRKTLGENLQEKVLKEFSLERMVEETVKLY